MLTSKAKLRARESSKPDALPRESYLAQLMNECTNKSTSPSAKEQCLAHLANFSYDPINFGYLLKLNLLDMFVDFLEEAQGHEKTKPTAHSTIVIRLSMQGICNLAADPRFQRLLVENNALPLILEAAQSHDEVTCTSALSTLYFLLDCPHDMIPVEELLQSEHVLNVVAKWTQCSSKVVRNTAVAFMTRRQERINNEHSK